MTAKAPGIEWEDEGWLSSREEVIGAIEELVASMAMARAEMRRAEQSLRRALRSIAEGETIESLIVLKPPAAKRQAFLDALEEVHRARHLVRQKVFTHALGAGLSISQMARAWGISRQLASRYVKEGLDRADAGPTEAARAVGPGEAPASVVDLRRLDGGS